MTTLCGGEKVLHGGWSGFLCAVLSHGYCPAILQTRVIFLVLSYTRRSGFADLADIVWVNEPMNRFVALNLERRRSGAYDPTRICAQGTYRPRESRNHSLNCIDMSWNFPPILVFLDSRIHQKSCIVN